MLGGPAVQCWGDWLCSMEGGVCDAGEATPCKVGGRQCNIKGLHDAGGLHGVRGAGGRASPWTVQREGRRAGGGGRAAAGRPGPVPGAVGSDGACHRGSLAGHCRLVSFFRNKRM